MINGRDFEAHCEVLQASGFIAALLGLSTNMNQPLHKMVRVADKMASSKSSDSGELKFLESINISFLLRLPDYVWPEFDTYRVGFSKQSQCFDDQVEVLSSRGFVLFKDLTRDDLVATVNLNTSTIEMQKPSDYIVDAYDGQMVKIKSSKMDMVVTPNHRFYGSSSPTGKLNVVEARDLSGLYIPKKFVSSSLPDIDKFELPSIDPCPNGNWQAKLIDMDTWLRFLGIYISQGNVTKNGRSYNIRLTHNRTDGTHKEIDKVLNALGYRYQKYDDAYKGSYSWHLSNKQLFTYLSKFGKSNFKYLPKLFRSLNTRQAKILLDWLCKGDGTKDKNGGYILYSTSSKLLADNIQELYIKHVGAANVYTRFANADRNAMYTVNFQKTDTYNIRKEHITSIRYTGNVYCVSVPNDTLIVRRNGRVLMTGNSEMHTLHKRGAVASDFECGDVSEHTLIELNELFKVYKDTMSSDDLVKLRRKMPKGHMTTRIVSTNIKSLKHLYNQRKNHRLPHWKHILNCLEEQTCWFPWVKGEGLSQETLDLVTESLDLWLQDSNDNLHEQLMVISNKNKKIRRLNV